MIVRLPTQRAFFFHSTQVQPESAGGLHRKKKNTYCGTISSLHRAGERWRPFEAAIGSRMEDKLSAQRI